MLFYQIGDQVLSFHFNRYGLSDEKDIGGQSRYIATHLQDLENTCMPDTFGYIEPEVEESHELGFSCEKKRTVVRHDKDILEELRVIYDRGEVTGHTTSAVQAHKLLCNATLPEGNGRKFDRKIVPEPSQIKSIFGRWKAQKDRGAKKKKVDEEEVSEAVIEEAADDYEIMHSHVSKAIAVKKMIASQDENTDRMSHPIIVSHF